MTKIKKYRLRKKYKVTFIVIILLVVSFIFIHDKNMNHLLKKSGDYVLNQEINSLRFAIKNDNIVNQEKGNSAEEKIKNNNAIFAVKEEKNPSPIIYIYNTHPGEKYKTRDEIGYTPDILLASKYLSEKLKSYELGNIYENRRVDEELIKNNLNFVSSYRISREFLEDINSKNKTIKYNFDIHRDAGTHAHTSLCDNNICYAKILLIIGLENNNHLENEKEALKIHNMLNEEVSGISKGILYKQGKGVNGIYNQDFSNRTFLIEIGGENNTIDEVYRTIDVLAKVIDRYIKEDK